MWTVIFKLRQLAGYVFSGLIVFALGVYVSIGFYDPGNYLVIDQTSATKSWQIHGAKLLQVDAGAPNGSMSGLKITSTSGDGHLILPSLYGSRDTPVTFSVYLRADSRTTINIGFFAKDYVSKTVRIGQEWQRFSVSGNPKSTNGAVSALVGGARTFLEGETIYLWGAQLNMGTAVKSYTAVDVSQQSWIDRLVNRLRLKLARQWFLWCALALLFALLAVSKDTSPVKWVRSKLSLGRRSCTHIFRENRFGLLSGITYAAIVLVTLVAMEAVAFGIISVRVWQAQRLPLMGAMSSTVSRAVSLVTADTQLGREHIDQATIFSPLTQIRRLPGDLTPPYHINKLGLIDNEGASPALDTMPEKPPGMVRIILYGGSTAMGIGAPAGNQTLSARLEKLLNRHARPGTVFQVLNFGHGGGQSFTDLSFMAAMGTYLDPDVSISLNGFNDAFFATKSSGVYGGYKYIINWSDFSYYYNNTINGLVPPRSAAISWLPFTSLLFNDLRMAKFQHNNAAKAFYDKMPMRFITENVDRANPLHDRLLLENLRFIAGYFINRDSILLSYLQPHPVQFRSLRTQSPAGLSEATLVQQSIARLSRFPEVEYRRKMTETFDAYGERYRELQNEYGIYPNIRFFDIRKILSDLPEPAYIDIIHYTVAAQQRLAERMFSDLMKFDVVRNGQESDGR